MYIGNIKNNQDLGKVVTDAEYITRCDSIRLKCLECKGFKVRAINLCTHNGCPLYRFRKGYVK